MCCDPLVLELLEAEVLVAIAVVVSRDPEIHATSRVAG